MTSEPPRPDRPEQDTAAAERAAEPRAGEHAETQPGYLGQRLNWLRAGVLGANDGIVSTAGIVLGVAAATADRGSILTAGIAGLLAGAMSMAVGEYVSVSAQRDTEKAMLDQERVELVEMADEELEELTRIYQRKGLSRSLAEEVARELTAHDALGAHAEAELGIDPDELTSPWQAALASFASFIVGAMLPLLAILLSPPVARLPVTFFAVLAALAVTGTTSARLGQAPRGGAVWRNVAGGAIAMAVTYGVGTLVGSAGL